MMGRGIVENPDEMDGEPWSPELSTGSPPISSLTTTT